MLPQRAKIRVMTPDGEPNAAWSRRYSVRARRLSVRVFFDGRVELVVPRGMEEGSVEAFVERHREWVASRLASFGAARPMVASLPPTEIDLTAIGERWTLRSTSSAGRSGLREVEFGLLEWRGEPCSSQTGQALRRWLHGRAEQVASPRFTARADAGGYRFAALRWRRQRTRWGSCSSRGVVSLNLCGLFQAPEVLDYLFCHELAHTRYLNHSAAYWAEVARICPNWADHDRALRGGWRRVPTWMFV